MPENKEFEELKEYVNDLKIIKSEVLKVFDGGNENDLSRASKHYPEKLNHLLTKRNIENARVVIPFLDLPFLKERKEDIDLIDLNQKKENIDLLRDVIQRIDRELEEL